MVDNKIYPAIRKSLAKRTKNRPISYVEPSTQEQEDTDAARIGTKVLTYFQHDDRLELDMLDEELLLWGDLCGNGYYWLRWNPTLKAFLTIPTKDGGYQKKEAQVGDLEVEVPTPFEIVSDVFGRWVVRSQLLPIDYLEEVYPDMAGKIKPAEEKVAGSHFEKKLLSLIGSELGAKDYNKAGTSKVALHVEYYHIATTKKPEGHKVVLLGKQLATEPDQENIYGFLPCVRFSPEMLPGIKNYGTSCMPHILAPQKSFNQARSLIKENRKLLVRPKIMIPESASLKETSFTSEAGEKIVYAGAKAPEYLRPPEITTQGTEKDMDRDLQAIDDCTAQHEPTRGMVPPGVKSGVGLAFLVEQDDTMLAPTTRRFELAKAKCGKKMLIIVQKMYKEERLLKIVGTDKTIESLRFKGSTIKDNTDVKVVPDSALPRSRTARRMEVMEYYKEGLFGDPRHPTTRKKVLKLLEFGSVTEMFEEENIDIKVQENENEMMRSGTPIMVQIYDNHEVHLQVIDKFVKGDDFKLLDPGIQSLFMQHRGLHIQAASNYELPGAGQDKPARPAMPGGGGKPPAPEEEIPEGGAPPAPEGV